MPKNSRAKTVSVLKRIGFISLGIFIIAAAVYGYVVNDNAEDKNTVEVCTSNPQLETKTVTSGEHRLLAEVASTGEQKTLGLSCRSGIGNDSAMLFEYELSGDYCYWMKDMKFAIDMVWLDDDKKIVTIKSDVAPDTYPQSFCPDKPARYVIEVNSGRAQSLGWQTGTQISF